MYEEDEIILCRCKDFESIGIEENGLDE